MGTVAVVGAGPAGMLAARQAALGGAKVILLEKNNRLGKKLVITGKGRCNVTNDADTNTLVKNMPGNGRFLYSAFTAFGSRDLQRFLEEHGVPLKVERGNRVFPRSDRSFDVVDGLRLALKRNNVEVRLQARVNRLLSEAGRVIGLVVNERPLYCDAVILCTGGASYPATGSTGDGYRLAEEVGHTIVPPRPALVPLEVVEEWPKTLPGLALKIVELTIRQGERILAQEFGEMLFTHYGVSGPIVLTVSRWVTHRRGNQPLVGSINLKPALTEEQLDRRLQRDLLKHQRKLVRNALDDLLPKRLIPVVISLAGLAPDKPVHQVTRAERRALLDCLTDLRFTIKGPRPLSEAIVTAGGVSTKEIDPKTMQSKLVSGLYFAGEIIDVDGYTGGFNLQAAFSTGYLAGEKAAQQVQGG
ncbi:MAG: NAD(P)/FAD-dependent oxidoreductase [Firmicutes bacterium]|nr:NAD(P)/FAD-dependent oxidoreductase [Bacillota bacterium]